MSETAHSVSLGTPYSIVITNINDSGTIQVACIEIFAQSTRLRLGQRLFTVETWESTGRFVPQADGTINYWKFSKWADV